MIDRPRRILVTCTETRLDGSSFDTTLEHTIGLPHAFDRLERRLD